MEVLDARIYAQNGQVVVEGAEGYTVTLYDLNGRVLATHNKRDSNPAYPIPDAASPIRFEVPASGCYLIKIGNYPARKVVVIR